MKLRLGALASLLILFLISTVVLAQDQQPTADSAGGMGQMVMPSATPQVTGTCDLQIFLLQSQAYANAMTAFPQVYESDPQAALQLAYTIGSTYQTFALNCGFVVPTAAAVTPDAAHDHSPAAHMALAMTIGNPDNGQILFNTITPQTGFACATCHNVNSADPLVGPGLINIADPSHDPMHHHEGDTTMTMPMPTESTSHEERTMEDVITYIRTSILNPSEFVHPGFPDLLMPQVYAQIFTEQQVNDIIAYLLTLHR